MQLVSLAITGGADKVKGPADIPSFTRAMPLYYEAARTAAIDYFLTPILGTDEHVAEIPYLPESMASAPSSCTCKCKGHGNLPGRLTRSMMVAFITSSLPWRSSARRPLLCSIARTGRSLASFKSVWWPPDGRTWERGTIARRHSLKPDTREPISTMPASQVVRFISYTPQPQKHLQRSRKPEPRA